MKEETMSFYGKKEVDVLKLFETSKNGLSSINAKKALNKFGFNEIKEKKKISPILIFLNQFNSVMIWILIGAVILSLVVGEQADAIVIAIIVILNSIFGFIQEYKAEKSIEALKKMTNPKTKVLRDGREVEIASKYIVPGDILILQEGDKISADARLILADNFHTQEAALTGESTPVKKECKIISKTVGIAEQKNMVFSGTVITSGYAKAIVIRTGMQTEIGKIASMIQKSETKITPLQRKLASLGTKLSILTAIICIVVFFFSFLRSQIGLIDSLMTSISLAVAAIPEGLPAVVTISLALGVNRMVKRKVLVRKLASVETLGCTTVICTDKTGTLTHNEMTVKQIFVDNEIIEVSGEGYNSNGTFNKRTKDLELLLKCGLLCNNANVDKEKSIGDPTEASLIISAAKIGMKKLELSKEIPRIKSIPFTSKRKMMSTLNKDKNLTLYCKGAPDVILSKCSKIIINGQTKNLTEKYKKQILAQNDKFAGNALRVLAFAYKEFNHKTLANQKLDESNLTFIGLQAMKDPPRSSVKNDIRICHRAGIKVVMITGDYKLTAKAIADEIGLKGKVLSGDEIPKDLGKIVDDIAVYARVNPEHKMQIIEALKKKGHIVAMTGDGVNDAPALKRADIGISMGLKGTEVAKEASDMILMDDSFSSIVNAIDEGRGIFNNIKKFVNYLLSSNLGEVLLIFLASLFGMPIPLIAIQILWVNLVTDGLPALALGVDPHSKGIMNKPPRHPKEKIVNKNLALMILVMGSLIGIFSLLLFKRFVADINTARTVAFTALVVFELARIHTIRSSYNLSIFSNKYLVGAVIISLLLQLSVIYTPLNVFFKTVPLGFIEWAYILGATILMLIAGTISVPIIRRITHQED